MLAGAAAAQSSSSADQAAPASQAPAATSDSDAAAVSARTGYNFNPGTPPATEDMAKAKAGDPGIVSNGPVPDTKANRAKFGQPISAAGRRTRPRGN
jgi:hypothetical protein